MAKYKVINSGVIEELGNRIVELCKQNGWGATSVYFNGKRVHIDVTDYHFTDDNIIYVTEETVKEDCHPGDYFDYYNHNHIVSMGFEGDLYDLINGYGEASALNKLLDEYGLYYELGNAWNLSVYPIDDDIEVDGYHYNEEPEPTMLYWWSEAPAEIKKIINEWRAACEETGDGGSCVIGAKIKFTWNGEEYYMYEPSPYQGCLSWEPHVDMAIAKLKAIGATDIYYDCGVLD